MGKIWKSKGFMAIMVVVIASSLFLISFGVTRFIINKTTTKQASQSTQEKVYDQKKEKEKFLKDNIKDEKKVNEILLQDSIDEAIKVAEENGEDPMEAVAEIIKEQNYTDEYKEYLKLSDEEKAKVEVIPREQKIDESEFEEIKKEQDEDLGELTEEQIEEQLPEKFDLRDKIDIKVESQGSLGLCWVFASNSAFETSLALKQGKYYDFSEIYIDYMLSIDLNAETNHWIHLGGGFDSWLSYVVEGGKFVLEDEAEYREYEEEEWIRFFNMETVDDTIVSNVSVFPNFSKSEVGREKFIEYQDIVKRHIENYGGVVASIYIDNEKDVFYSDKNKKANHAVCVIGWDDNYAKENFKNQNGDMPNENGAYIVLNSWGENSGYNGYIYVSYEDVNVNKEMYGIVVGDDESSLVKLSDINNEPIEQFIREKCDILLIDGQEYVKSISLYSIKAIDLQNSNLESLKGIEYFPNIYSINISGNNVEDISKLQSCKKLNYLDAANNKLKDVSCLQGCNELDTLDLSGNEKVSGYEYCDNLTRLYLNNCDIENIESVNNLSKLRRLEIANNENIEDIEQLSFENINDINLSGTGFKKLSELTEKRKNWERIDLSYNNLDSLEGLDADVKIWKLNLSGNKKITEYSKLDVMEIVCLYLADCDIQNLSVLPTKNKYIYLLDISNNDINEEFSKLSSMYNLHELKMIDCNLNDISEINRLNQINLLDVSNNKEISGDLKESKIKYIYLCNCDLDSSFNFFNYINATEWKLDGNDVDLSKLSSDKDITVTMGGIITEEFMNSLPQNIKLKGVTEEKTLYIPNNRNVNLYSYELGGKKTEYIQEINSKVKAHKIPSKFDLNSIDSFRTKSRSENPVLYRVVKTGENIKPETIKITKYQSNFNNTEEANIDKLIVEEKLCDGVYVETDEYTTNFNKDRLIQGRNYVTIYYNDMEKDIVINIVGSDGYVILTFKDRNLYNTMKDLSRGISDDSTKSIKLNKATIVNLENSYISCRIPYEVLYDIDSLKGIDLKQITIVFSNSNSVNDKINEDDIEKLKIFKNLKYLDIYDDTGSRTEESSIVDQDTFKVSFSSKRSMENSITLIFEDELLYKLIKGKINGIVGDSQKNGLKLILLPEQAEELKNDSENYITIQYESLYDIKALAPLEIHSLGIEFSEDISKVQTITEQDLLNLSNLHNINTLYITDKSETRAKEDMIVDQDKYTVYINGELYQERSEDDENKEYTNTIYNDVNTNNIT